MYAIHIQPFRKSCKTKPRIEINVKFDVEKGLFLWF